MSKVNRGKSFEDIVRAGFESAGISCERLHDQTTKFRGSTNPCDFIVFKAPYQYYIECKTHYGNTLPFSDIADSQWTGLTNRAKYPNTRAGVMIWFMDHDLTVYIPIQMLNTLKALGKKSVNIKELTSYYSYEVPGHKKRVFFEYDMRQFLWNYEANKLYEGRAK